MPTALQFPFPGRYWLRQGYGYSRANQHSALTTRLGRQLLRIGTGGASRFTASLLLSRTEVADFDAWCQHVLKGGGLWFNAPVLASGLLETREVRFLDISEPEQLEGVNHWRVTASFETRVGTQASLQRYLGLLSFEQLLIG